MRKILSLVLGLLFSISANAGCNLWNLNEITHKDVTNYVVNETGFSGTGNTAVNAFVSTNQTFPAGTYTFSFTVTPTTSPFFIFGASDLSKIYINGINNFTDNSGITAYFHTAHGSYTNTGTKVKIKSSVPFKIGFALAGITYTFSDIKLERGDTATEYTPYNPLCETCDGTVVNYTSAMGTVSQSGTPTPDNPIDPTFYKQGNMVLRKVGDYADSYDATTGKITRRVGVAVLDGSEAWGSHNNIIGWFQLIDPIFPGDSASDALSTHYLQYSHHPSDMHNQDILFGKQDGTLGRVVIRDAINFPELGSVRQFKSWLAQQYQAGTPVTVYYPLAEETTEDWPASYCERPIKIATTKYNETAFGPLNTALANAISVVDSVVTQTITQAGRIADLQAQKQTRPADDPSDANNAENCPVGKKCLLVEDASGTPHWYEIVEKYSRLPDGYTELEYIEGTGTQYIDTGIANNSLTNPTVEITLKMLEFADVIWFGTPTVGAKGIFYNIQTSSPETWYVRWCSQRYDDRPLTYQPGKSVLDLVFTDALHTVKLTGTTNLSVYVDDELVGTSTYDSCAFTATGNILLFGVALSDTKRKMQLGMWKISNNDTLLQHLIPAKRNSDGAIGMFDTVSGEFFTNKGSGSFIAGPVSE